MASKGFLISNRSCGFWSRQRDLRWIQRACRSGSSSLFRRFQSTSQRSFSRFREAVADEIENWRIKEVSCRSRSSYLLYAIAGRGVEKWVWHTAMLPWKLLQTSAVPSQPPPVTARLSRLVRNVRLVRSQPIRMFVQTPHVAVTLGNTQTLLHAEALWCPRSFAHNIERVKRYRISMPRFQSSCTWAMLSFATPEFRFD